MPSCKTSKEQKNILTFSGKGALSEPDTVLCKYKEVLIFNDKNGFAPCGAEAYFKQAEEALKDKTRFSYFPYAGKALPLEDIEAVYREVKKVQGAQAIVAVGGGTVIDLAKIIAIAYSNHCDNVVEIIENKELENRLDLIFIPTTAGTGSEATSFAVVYRDKQKISIDKISLLADYIVLDPNLLISLPEPVLNATILDALSQAIESAWAKGADAVSKEFAGEAIALIVDNLEKERNIDRLEQLQIASHLAGRAINISRTTLCHSISYPLTSHFGIPHGVAVFLTLPEVAALNCNAKTEDLQPGLTKKHIRESFEIIFGSSRVEGIREFQEKLKHIMQYLGYSLQLSDYGIKETDLEFLADLALTKGRSDNNPRNIQRDQILKLLQKIY